MDHLIIKYLTNEISLEERHQLSKWLEEDEMHPEILEKFQLYWEMSQQDFGSERKEVLNHIESEIGLLEQQEPPSANAHKPNRFFSFFKYAAVLALVFVTIYLVYEQNKSQEQPLPAPTISYEEKISNPGQKITTTLPDGTTVKLNSGSKIIVPSHFVGEKREVVLFGEAFFDVTRDESKPFIIKTADMSIKVLGTSFGVKANADRSAQFVAVKSGKVKVINTSNSDSVELTQNLMAFLSDEGKFSEIDEIDESVVFGWVDQKMVFKDNSLPEVFKSVEKWFGVKINNTTIIDSKKPYTATFDNPTLPEVMGSLAYIYQFKYEIENKIISIQK